MRTHILEQNMSPFEGKFFVLIGTRDYLLTNGRVRPTNGAYYPRVAPSLYYFDTREEAEVAVAVARIKGVIS